MFPTNEQQDAPAKKTVINPYLSTKRQHLPQSGSGLADMGLHSKQRVGSVLAAKRHGAGRKKEIHKRSDKRKNFLGTLSRLGDGHGFDAKRHCVVCKAMYLGRKKPHRPHHAQCERNTTTKGKSAETVRVCKEAHANQERNSCPPASSGPTQGTTALQKHDAVWGVAKRALQPGHHVAVAKDTTAQLDIHCYDKPSPPLPSGQYNYGYESLGWQLRTELQRRYASLADSSSPDHERYICLLKNKNKTLPVAIALLFDYINEETRITPRSRTSKVGDTTKGNVSNDYSDSLKQRHRYFPPNMCTFTIPRDPSPDPFPPYHSIEGQLVFSLDWEIMFRDFTMPKCMETGCSGDLVRERSNFSKNRKLFPVYISGGIPMWGSCMLYKCHRCKTLFSANDGCFLAKLDEDIASSYPVLARYALANYRFHLSVDVTEQLEWAMLTYGGGDSFSRQLHRSQGIRYTEVVKSFAAKAHRARRNGIMVTNWTIKFQDWNGKFIPSGSQLRSYYFDGAKSPFTMYGYSQVERCQRELQIVGKDTTHISAAIDWTFQVLKTYITLPGAKACFTMKISDGQIAGLAIVKNTALAEVSHFMLQLVSKRGLNLQVLYTDQWPVGSEFWKGIFGPLIIGRLGLFHAMKRITDTFRKTVDTELLQKAMYDFKKCFYSVDPIDTNNLYQTLKNGTMSPDGHCYSDSEICDLEQTSRWSQRYAKFLKKTIHPGTYIQQMLSHFVSKWNDVQDTKTRKVFTEETVNSIQEQVKNLTYVCDPPGIALYREVKAGPNSRHGLSQWVSLRMESQLEKSHHLLAHYGNSGMGTPLADALILRGITETNTRVRHNYRKTNEAFPSHFDHVPLFWDESELDSINQMLQDASLDPVFEGVKKLPADNGEVFLSEYFHEQQQRNRLFGSRVTPQANMCSCPCCHSLPKSQVYQNMADQN